MTTKVFYHANCYDGFGAAYIAWKHLGDGGQYIPCYYSDPVPVVNTGDRVYVLDFSFPRAILEDWSKKLAFLKVLDHHKSVMEDIADLPCVVFDLDRSGAVLSYDYFYREMLDIRVAQLAKHLQDRDLWKFKYEGTKEIHAALCSYPFDFQVWDKLNMDTLKKEGKVILRYHEILTQRICDQSHIVNIGGYDVPIVNTCLLFSEVPEELLKRYPEAKFAAYKYERNNVIQYGLRSRTDFDVSEVAKLYGGGGHKQAAGFELKNIT